MPTQNYANHRQTVPVFHKGLLPLLLLSFVGSGFNLYSALRSGVGINSASLIVLIFIALMMLSLFVRIFALKAQDRAIRAEENLRHFVLTGKLLDPATSIRQVVALRFAADGEFAALAERAVRENLSADAIKQAVRNWRADTYRV